MFSVVQTDVVYYGRDFHQYVACEFGRVEWATAVAGDRRRIRFRTELVLLSAEEGFQSQWGERAPDCFIHHVTV
ncbi:MAG: hypothetical protein HY304_07845 [candidate division Zixibacteria bacterium]|nr:hypothetical protein [candidate division Zixibacteria bacterium]